MTVLHSFPFRAKSKGHLGVSIAASSRTTLSLKLPARLPGTSCPNASRRRPRSDALSVCGSGRGSWPLPPTFPLWAAAPMPVASTEQLLQLETHVPSFSLTPQPHPVCPVQPMLTGLPQDCVFSLWAIIPPCVQLTAWGSLSHSSPQPAAGSEAQAFPVSLRRLQKALCCSSPSRVSFCSPSSAVAKKAFLDFKFHPVALAASLFSTCPLPFRQNPMSSYTSSSESGRPLPLRPLQRPPHSSRGTCCGKLPFLTTVPRRGTLRVPSSPGQSHVACRTRSDATCAEKPSLPSPGRSRASPGLPDGLVPASATALSTSLRGC